jgi:hypothetical protein
MTSSSSGGDMTRSGKLFQLQGNSYFSSSALRHSTIRWAQNGTHSWMESSHVFRIGHWALKAEARLNKDSLHGSASGTETAKLATAAKKL